MVIKTDTCSFTESKIYPSRLIRYIAKDGKITLLQGSKAKSLFHQRIKPVKLRWTQAWRRHNKKGKNEEVNRKRNRRTQKVQRAIVGLTLDDLKNMRSTKHKEDARKAAVERSVKEAKEKQEQRAARQVSKPKTSAPVAKQVKSAVATKPATKGAKAARR